MSNADILKLLNEINKRQFGFEKQIENLIAMHNTSTLSIRTDIEAIKTTVDVNRDLILETYKNHMIGQTAELASLSDRVVTTCKTAFVTATPKRATKANATTSSTSTQDKSEKNATNVDAHCNFGNLPPTSWKSSKQYATKMFKLYPEHIKTVLGPELMTAIMDNEYMKALPIKIDIHKKSLAFCSTIWMKLSSELREKAIDLIEADRITENDIRVNGTFNHVAIEDISTEEAEVIADTADTADTTDDK
jgi:hypothetical protein